MHARSLIRAALIAVAAAAIFVATVAPVALGDGDPASDVLLGQNVFYPYQPPVTASLQKTIDAETGAAQKAGFPIKVALIASPVDLGVIPDLFGQPQKYANFLDQEISFQTKQRLLVVMSTGYGVVGFPAASQNALGSVASPAGKHSDELAKAAITAVAKLAGAAGHPIQGVPGVTGSGSAGGGAATAIVAVLVIGALATAAALVALTVRRRRQASSA